ncbi:TadE/TadG family type IV pilus assembly protein [Blastomonas sp. AAP25]|uniref:TadE/TadG family type IV pilus assembly protein n=1 Tax=Blastomonas sp. AAP25 TaxID=1523416 RepID=UPI0006B9A519|nr:TadE/TadG family type IV pilus assembly protein [Blastomonas sp. AAP25]
MTIRTTDTQHRHDAIATRKGADQTAARRPWLNRLLASKRGNVLPIVAASILPMAAMIGGAVDMSRAYMVKTRIQQACDAGVLAGRRAMQQSSYSDAAKAQAQDFFDINFKAGYNDSHSVTFNTSNPAGTSKVLGSASTVMPTAIMGMFGKKTIPIDVTCEAELNLSNSDVTFVLDVTGSMNDSIPVGGGGSIVKITALRNSVMSFYDTLANAATGSLARIRYAFVPYSTNVNVGEILYDTNTNWLNGGNAADSWNYQSRRPLWNVTSTSTETLTNNQTLSFNVNATNCTNYGNNTGFWQGWTQFSPNPSGNPTTETSGNTTTKTTYQPWRWGGVAGPWSSSGTNTCVRRRTREITTTTVTETAVWQAGATFSRWEYLQRSYPTFDFVRSIKSANPAVPTPSEINGSTSRWSGCIEERDTIAGAPIAYGSGGITVNGNANAHDLNIDAVPNSDATKWRPHWEDVYFFRNDPTSLKNYGGGYTACPSKARLLATMTRTDVQNYVNSLVAVGGTYHDVGLLWGARVASPQGIFSSNVNASPGNGGSVGRHLIFMTDGELTSYDFVASMYGLEMYDQRVTGGSTSPNQLERQRQRYLAICEAIKAKGIRLWVIAFGTTLTTDLQTCSSSGSSFTAANSSQLNTAFQNIAKQISELRLTK